MELALTSIGIICLRRSAILIFSAWNKNRWKRKVDSLRGRVVRFKRSYSDSYGIGQYGVIAYVRTSNNKIIGYTVEVSDYRHFNIDYHSSTIERLMPIGFDIDTETVTKSLDPKKKGVRSNMPRIFKLIWLGLVTAILWDFTANINNIITFLVHAK